MCCRRPSKTNLQMNMEPEDQPKSSNAAFNEKKRNHGPIAGLFIRAAGRVGLVEQTRLAPEFLHELDKYFTYQEKIDGLLDRLEGCVQMNPQILETGVIEAPEKSDPYELFARSIKHFRSMLPEDQKPPMVTIEAMAKRLALIQRENQLESRRSIRKIRRFVSNDYNAMVESREKLMEARDLMDSTRNDLKQAKTSAAVEEKGKVYEIAVHEFDMQAGKMMDACDALTHNKLTHQRELLDLFEVQAHNHKLAAGMLANHMKVIGVQHEKK